MHKNKKPGTKAGQKNVVRHCINCLTRFTSGAHTLPQVLNTPPKALPAHVRQADFLRPLVSQWPGSAQLCNSLRVKSASGSLGRVEVPGRPSTGRHFNETKGANHG